MSRGTVNKVILIGNLGADPEVRYMPNGGAVTTIRIATTEAWKDKNTGQPQERTEWHRVVFYQRLAEIAGEYLKKGSKVYLEGSLRTQQWEKEGQKHYTTDVIANEMQMLDRAGDNQGQSGPRSGGYAASPAPANRGPSNPQEDYGQAQPARYQEPAFSKGSDEGFDDDIPF